MQQNMLKFIQKTYPINIGITSGTPSVTALVVVSDLGCSKVFMSLTWR